jgi:NAD+ kinase
VCIYEPYFEQLQAANFVFHRLPTLIATHQALLDAKLNFVITLGGDGTILHAIQLIRDSGIPVAGINLGRLGFLAVADQAHASETLDCLLTQKFTLDPRRLIDLSCNLPIFQDFHYALNDFTITKRDTSSMIVIHTYLNGGFLNSYWADGLIVSTPTGSTGYSLSCGGPIIFPNSGNFVVTPIAPHNLNVRPIVLHDSSTISFEIEGRADSFLCTLDSRYEAVTSEHRISVTCANFRINLVRLNDYTFLSTIRTKLSWGIDSRN